MERFSLATEQGHYDGMRARLGYSESPSTGTATAAASISRARAR